MSPPKEKKRRVTVKIPDPNPLFVQWLTEWKERAQENESKLQHTFSTALKSLQKYPLPLESGKDCKILHGFGDKLCQMLDDKLVQHNHKDMSNGDKRPNGTSKKRRSSHGNATPNKEYVPQIGSGPYAILITLYERSLEINYPGFLLKTEIIQFGQSLCNTSFTKPEPNSRYTAWSSMKTLLDKKLVLKKSSPAKFTLTDEGVQLAVKLHGQQTNDDGTSRDQKTNAETTESKNSSLCPGLETESSKPGTSLQSRVPSTSSGSSKNSLSSKPGTSLQSRVPSTSSVSSKSSLSRHASSTSTKSTESNFESVIFAPETFEIILLVDTQEVGSKNADPAKDPLVSELQKLHVKYEIRDLKVGDYTWICRTSAQASEIILPYVIERKRMDDLGQSIKDGRFYEQKHRLKNCGLNNRIYLVENYGRNEHLGLPLSSILQGAVNTAIQDEFTLKFTENLRETCFYLSCMSDLLTKLFKNKTLVSCTKADLPAFNLDEDLLYFMDFKEFNRNSLKNKQLSIKDMFVRHLLQIKTMSFDKALAIADKYPTPRHLREEYANLDDKQGESLLAKLKCGNPAKNLGPALSKTIYQFYTSNLFQ